MERTIYISLPITGRDETRQRRLAGLWAHVFTRKGYNVVNPFDLYEDLKTFLGREPSYDEIMKVDLSTLRSCTDMLLVDDWHNSNGCMDEIDVATKRGIKLHYDLKVKLNWG